MLFRRASRATILACMMGLLATVCAIPQAALAATAGPTVISPSDGQTISYSDNFSIRVQPVEGASGYLYGFFQNSSAVWENYANEHSLSGTEYTILANTPAHAAIKAGALQIWVRALVNGAWTDATVLNVTLTSDGSAQRRPADQPSNNYAGYVAISGRYTHALTTFQVPSSKCPPSVTTQSAVGYWLGLGVTGKTLEQAGVTTHCVNGIGSYGAFYEMIPGPGPQILNPVQYPVFPGDFVDVDITFTEPNMFTMTIKDGWWNFTTSQPQSDMAGALDAAAFITEAPGNDVSPLTNFGTAHFQNSWANDTLLTDLDQSARVQKWIMVDKANQVKAQPSALTPYGGHGPAFDVNWVSAGP
jgi:Peptidase A4 family